MEKSNRFNCPTCADCLCCISTVFLAMDEMVLQILMYVKTSGKAFFTARKRSTGTPPRKVHPPAGTLPGQVLTPGRYPQGTPPWQVLPKVHTPWAGTPPPGQVHTGRYTPGQVHPHHSACWDTVNKWAVRIPLECILVVMIYLHFVIRRA